MTLGDVFPALARLPAFPVALVLCQVGRHFTQQHVHRLEGTRRVLGHHDAEVLQAALAGVDVALPGKEQVDQEDVEHHQHADQRNDQSEGFGLAFAHAVADAQRW